MSGIISQRVNQKTRLMASKYDIRRGTGQKEGSLRQKKQGYDSLCNWVYIEGERGCGNSSLPLGLAWLAGKRLGFALLDWVRSLLCSS